LPDIPAEKVESILNKYSVQFQNLQLRTDFLRCSSNPFRNLVHQLKINGTYQAAAETFSSAIPDFHPKKELHISLKYGFEDCAELDRAWRKINIQLPQKVVFSSIDIIRLGKSVEEWKSVFSKTI